MVGIQTQVNSFLISKLVVTIQEVQSIIVNEISRQAWAEYCLTVSHCLPFAEFVFIADRHDGEKERVVEIDTHSNSFWVRQEVLNTVNDLVSHEAESGQNQREPYEPFKPTPFSIRAVLETHNGDVIQEAVES